MQDRNQFIDQSLITRRGSDRLRTLRTFEPYQQGFLQDEHNTVLLDVSGNDYLGLSKHPEIKDFARVCLDRYGNGSTGSRLITGSGPLHHTLEEELATWLGRETSLIFNSGYQMNVSLIAALSDKHTHLFFDKRNHNSLLQGALLSKATLHRYRHADYLHLEELLKKHSTTQSRSIIVTESVFSMDGDISNLDEIAKLADRYNAILIVDEAHATGIWGKGGRGFSFGIDRVDIVLGTFGKSFGSFGAYAVCSAAMKAYLINFCGGFIYTTALPPAVVGASLAALRLMPELDQQRNMLIEHAAYLRKKLTEDGLDVSGSASQIIPIVLGQESAAIEMAKSMEHKGFLTTPIRPPTVQKGTSRLRITISSFMSRKVTDQLYKAINQSKIT